MKSKHFTTYLSFCLVFLLGVTFTNSIPLNEKMTDYSGVITSTHQDNISTKLQDSIHETIQIFNDTKLENMSSRGTGTEIDPFIIENLFVSLKSATCLHIENVTKYFIVQNSQFYDNGDWTATGIKLVNVLDGRATIKNNKINYFFTGIKIVNSSSTKVIDNYISSTIYGVYCLDSNYSVVDNNYVGGPYFSGIQFSDSHNSTAKNNIVRYSSNKGIALYSSDFVVVYNNTVEKCESGIYVGTSTYPIMYSNTLEDNEIGLEIKSCKRSSTFSNIFINNTNIGLKISGSSSISGEYPYIGNNNFTNDGIIFDESSLSIYLNYDFRNTNMLNNRSIGLFLGLMDTSIDLTGYGQVIIAHCTRVNFYNAYITHTRRGISLDDSYNCKISYSVVKNNVDGIYAYTSDNTNISNCLLESNSRGVYVETSDHVTIFENDLLYNSKGINTNNAWHVSIYNNSFIKCSIYINEGSKSYYNSYIIENNSINGLEIGFFVSISNFTLNTDNIYGQILLFYCENVTINGLSFNSFANAIDVKNSKNITTTNCIFSDCNLAIAILDSNNIYINNNLFFNNSRGISTNEVDYCIIESNIFNQNGMGVYQYNSYVSCILFNNTFTENAECARLIYSENVVINKNLFYNSTKDAVTLDHCDYILITNNNFVYNHWDSIYIYRSDYCTFSNNNLSYNYGYVFYVHYSENNLFTRNLFAYGSNSAINLNWDAINNTFYNNTFLFNGNYNIMFISHNVEGKNLFYNETLKLGNFYSDYDGSGNYTFSYGRGVDLYPNITVEAPRIKYSPEDVFFREDHTDGESISWRVMDDNPTFYQIFRNGTKITQDTWELGDIITIPLENHTPGIFNYTLVLFDDYNQTKVDEVFIEIDSVDKYIPQVECLNTNLTFVKDYSYEEVVIYWNISDIDSDSGRFFVYKNGSLLSDSYYWSLGSPLAFYLYDLPTGVWEITILVEDHEGLTTTNTVIITVIIIDPYTYTYTEEPYHPTVETYDTNPNSQSKSTMGFSYLAMLLLGILFWYKKRIRK